MVKAVNGVALGHQDIHHILVTAAVFAQPVNEAMTARLSPVRQPALHEQFQPAITRKFACCVLHTNPLVL